jgi:C4-dicarboxylate-specific signal transduction histidine kinase
MGSRTWNSWRTRQLSVAQGLLTRVGRLTTMGRLAASITHEIAQPVSAMLTTAGTTLRLLTNRIPDLDEAREAVRAIVKDGERAAEVFRSIRSLVQRAEPRMSTLDINDVIEEVLVLARGELQNENILVHVDLEASLPRLRGDRVQLQQSSLELGHERHTGNVGRNQSPASFNGQVAALRTGRRSGRS